MRVRLRLVTLVIILAFLPCCSFPRRPTTQPSILVPPSLEAVRLSNEGIRSLRGVARSELVYQGKRIRIRQAIALAKPGFMRIETLNFLDQPVFILATDGATLQAMSLSENLFYRGTVSQGLNHFMRLEMSSQELISLILGEIPPRQDGSISYDPRRRLYRLAIPPSRRWETQTFWIEPKTLRVVEVSSTDRFGRDEIRVFFSQFRKTGSFTFPREIRIDVPVSNDRIQLGFRKIEINPFLPSDLFRLSVPPGVEVVEISESMSRPPETHMP